MAADLFKNGVLPSIDDLLAVDQFRYLGPHFIQYMRAKFGDGARAYRRKPAGGSSSRSSPRRSRGEWDWASRSPGTSS